jgi:hypothetical protein
MYVRLGDGKYVANLFSHFFLHLCAYFYDLDS